MNLTETKVFSLSILGIGTILVGLLPACFSRHGRQQWPMLLSMLLCFGGGVLLSTSLMHILPELRDSMPQYAELIFSCGFFILYIIDELVHYCYGNEHELDFHMNNGDSNHARRHSANYGAILGQRQSLIERQPPYNPHFNKARSENDLFSDLYNEPSQLCHVGHQEPCHSRPTINFGLLAALSVHSLLEGLVVGLEGLPSKVLLLLGAVASHKLVVSFCLGVEIASNPLNSFGRHFWSIFIFTFGSLFGIVVGMVVSSVPNEVNNFVVPILQGLAGGTLLYVTVSEIIPRERARWHQQNDKRAAGLFQFIAVLCGFTSMTILSKYLDMD